MFSNQRAIFQLYSGREHLIWMESPCIFNLSVLHIWFKTWMESPCMFNLSGSKLLDGIFLYVQFVSTSCLGQNFYIESHCMFNLSVLYVWFKTFGCNHPVCSTCQYFMSGSKPLDVITLYVQLVSTSCLVQNFWIEPPCMFNLSVLHVWLKTFGWIHPVCSTCLVQNFWMESSCMFNLSTSCLVQTFVLNHPVCSTCQYLMSGTKLLDGITLYVQLVCSSCLIQNFGIESSWMFNLSVLHVWFKTFGWNRPACSICQYFMSGLKHLDEITLYVQLVSTSCLVQNFWNESPCKFNLSVLHVWFKTFG